MDLNLQSFPDFETVYNRVELQKESLKSVVEVGIENLSQLEVEYQDRLLKGEKVDSVSKKMITLKADVKNAREELEMLETSGLSLSPLADAVTKDYHNMRQGVHAEVSRLWEQSEQEIAAATERIQALKEQAASLLDEYTHVTNEQYIPVIDHLPVNDDSKSGMHFHATQEIAQLHIWPGI